MATEALAQEVVPQLEDANFFELRRGVERFSFTAENFTGQPQLNYHDGQQERTYTGNEIRLEKTAPSANS